MTKEEQVNLEHKALAVWAQCEKDQSVQNVLDKCKMYGISYAQAIELKDYCIALNAKSTRLKRDR